MNAKLLIVKAAINTLKIEAQSIQNLENSINEDFIDSVELIFNMEGRLVVTGIGKSAIIAQKIVATLNSTGTPALFMHAADAAHGDLGMITPKDVVLCISKSGTTTEIEVIIPLLKTFGNKLIAMVSNTTSILAKQAHYVLLTPIAKEADPNNLAPTASTTAQMAMGDALAMALLAKRGFTSQHFAQLHPGGALGKQLYLKVNDIYVKNEKPVVSPTQSLSEVIFEISSKRLGITVVVDEQDRVLGAITDGDLRRMLNQSLEFNKLKASDIMGLNPKCIEDSTWAVEALRIMREHSITQIVITKDGIYKGIVHIHDLIREGIV